MKPGFKTTEFWMTLVTMIGMMGLAAFAMSRDGSDTAAVLTALGADLSTVGYSIARSKVKRDAEIAKKRGESDKQ